MRDISPSFYSRGTSVLAALVVAAVLGSIGLLVQETSPVALIAKDSQSAATAAPAQNAEAPATIDQKTECVKGYNYQVFQKGGAPVTSCRHDMDCKTDSPQTSTQAGSQATKNGQCAQSSSVVAKYDQAQCDAWKCKTTYCVADKTDPSKSKCFSVAGDGAQPGEKISANDSRREAAQALTDAITAGEMSSSEAQDLVKQDPAFQQALEDAFVDKESDIEDAVGKAASASDDAQNALASLGCDSGSANTLACTAAKAQYEEAQKKLEDLTDQYGKLQTAQKSLAPGDSPDPNAGKTSDSTGCNGNASCQQVYKENQAMRDALNRQLTGFGDNNKMPAGGQGGGGQKSGGGGSGGGGQQQQQCEPRYVCNGNAVMYLPCANRGQSNAQMIQQCPTGYSCSASNGSSNSSCQIQAPYGYCADGHTPRTAPAQQQPPASSCTVGTWQDTSNGCQTGWQCKSGTGQSTAQISCQPQTATAGMDIAISYACAGGATSARAQGFTIPANSLSGTTSVVAEKPTLGDTVTYGLTCANGAETSSAQCTVRVGRTSIVLIATPEKVQLSDPEETKRQSTIGWVTTGMQSCVISSPELSTWSDQQKGISSVAGAVTSPTLTADANFVLTCKTLGGTEASSTVKVIAI